MKALIAGFSIGKEVWGRVKSKFTRSRPGSNGVTLEIQEIPEPELPAPDWVKIRPIMSGISCSDEDMVLSGDPYAFGPYVSFPFVPGNETFGIVTDIGEHVENLELGERVIFDPILSCRVRAVEPLCPSCASGEPSFCRNFGRGVLGPGMMIGGCKDTGGGWGYSLVAHKSQVRPVPSRMESDHVLLVPEFTRALRAVLQNPPGSADRVIIVGARSLGLLTLRALQILDLDRNTLVVAENPHEADAARKLGATEVALDAGPGTACDAVARFTEGTVRYPEVGKIVVEGGADLVYETTGSGEQIEDAARFTGERKTLVQVAPVHSRPVSMVTFGLKGIGVRSYGFSGLESYHGEVTDTFDLALDMASQHGLPHEDLLTHRFTIEQHAEAFSTLSNRAGFGAIKVIFSHVV
ncbi:MAG: zinc-binding dehydrogenase [Thermodesulfobacteriota bacterium]